MRAVLGLSLLPLLAAALPSFKETSIHKGAAPVLSAENAVEIDDSYIVVFKKHVTHATATEHHDWVQDLHFRTEQVLKTDLKKRSLTGDVFTGLKHTYNVAGSLLGYSGHFHEDVIEEIRKHPDVDYIEKDQEVHVLKDDKEDPELQKGAPWGLARISHRKSLSFGTFNKYLYSEDGGEGVDVYIIDTGTNVKHVDFEGRASWGKTIPAGDADEDGNGHGTHCSGTVAGKKYGVAKKAHVKAVKVLRSNGSGSMSDVISGVQWAYSAHEEQVELAKKGKRKGFKGSTANMSLGGGKSPTLDRIVDAAVEQGLHFAVAAGNDNANACNYSPAASKLSVTVGASTFYDERAYFSNWGNCTDIFAPGLNIQSTWIGSKYAVNTISGTSMASPHIAGLLAYLLSLQPAKDSAYAVAEITPAQLKKNLISIGTVGALTEIDPRTKTPNILAWNGGGKSNYSEIVEDGGYELKGSDDVESPEDFFFDDVEAEMIAIHKYVENQVVPEIESVEEDFATDFEYVEDKIASDYKFAKEKVNSKAKQVSAVWRDEREMLDRKWNRVQELMDDMLNELSDA